MKPIIALMLLVFLFAGCGGSSYQLKVVDEQSGEIFLTVSGDDSLKVGDVFALYSMSAEHASHNSGGGGHDHGGGGGGGSSMSTVTGYVKVTEVFDKAHGKVQLISGHADARAKVERVGEKKHQH